MDKWFVDGLMRAELAGPGNWCPHGLLVGSDSQDPRLREGWPLEMWLVPPWPPGWR